LFGLFAYLFYILKALTLSITTFNMTILSTMTLSITTLRVMTFSIRTLSITIKKHAKLSLMTLYTTKLSVVYAKCYLCGVSKISPVC